MLIRHNRVGTNVSEKRAAILQQTFREKSLDLDGRLSVSVSGLVLKSKLSLIILGMMTDPSACHKTECVAVMRWTPPPPPLHRWWKLKEKEWLDRRLQRHGWGNPCRQSDRNTAVTPLLIRSITTLSTPINTEILRKKRFHSFPIRAAEPAAENSQIRTRGQETKNRDRCRKETFKQAQLTWAAGNDEQVSDDEPSSSSSDAAADASSSSSSALRGPPQPPSQAPLNTPLSLYPQCMLGTWGVYPVYNHQKRMNKQ